MSMKINTATSVIAENVFPQPVFAGTIELSESQITNILKEISRMKLHKYNWGLSGWNEDKDEKWNLTSTIQKVSPLIVKQCHDAVTNHYNFPSIGNIMHIGNNQHFLEMRRCFPIILNPGHDFPYHQQPTMFAGVTILSCTDQGHKVYTRNLARSLHFQDKMKFWMPEVKQQLFLPNTFDWGVSAGTDQSQTVALISHIVLKRI